MPNFVVEFKKVVNTIDTKEVRHVKTYVDNFSGLLNEIAQDTDGLEFLTIRKVKPVVAKPTKKETK